MDRYATHLQALAWAAGRTEGPILELGAGWYSTPMLAGLAEATGRRLVTVEPSMVLPWPTVLPDEYEDLDWGLVLVDHEPAERGEAIRRYRGAMIVVHDTGPDTGYAYPGMMEALEEFPHRRDFTDLEPWTTVVW